MKINPKLIAPCGMNCAICSAYLAYKNNLPKIPGKIYHCKGCRIRNKKCAYIKKDCPDHQKILKGKIDFCYQCNMFPCDHLVKLDSRYRKNYQMSMIKNLQEIKGRGLNEFIKCQYQKYHCPKCGGLKSVHNKKCFYCNKIEFLKD